MNKVTCACGAQVSVPRTTGAVGVCAQCGREHAAPPPPTPQPAPPRVACANCGKSSERADFQRLDGCCPICGAPSPETGAPPLPEGTAPPGRETKREGARQARGREKHPNRGQADVGENFWRQLPLAFVFPFRGRGLGLLVFGSVFMGVLYYCAWYGLWAGMLFGLGYWGVLAAHMSNTMVDVGSGKSEAPEWPDFSDILGNVFLPLWRMVFTFAVTCSPLVLWLVFLLTNGAGEAGVEVFGASRMSIGLFVATTGLFLLAYVLFPMAYLAVSMTETVWSLFSPIFWRSFLRVPGQYLAVITLLFVASGLSSIALDAGNVIALPFVGEIAQTAVRLYLFTLTGFLLGKLYRCCADRLDWY